MDPTGPTSSVAPVAMQGDDAFDTVATAQPLVGERYELIRLAGSGGMGRVFAARDSLLHRTVAIKFLRSWTGVGSGDSSARDRLIAEARAMAGLSHPNLCRVLEISVDSPVPFMVMEWIDGVDLLAAARSMNLAGRLDLFQRVVEGVASAHRAGIVHRDLKPQNILVDARGEPFIVDFGLARGSRGNAEGLTSAGTPGYAPPEQMAGVTDLGPRADVYSLGVILFVLLTNKRPFEGANSQELVVTMRETDPPLPEEIAPETPEALQRICLKAMERSSSARYADASELAQDIARYRRGETVAARPTMLAGRFTEQLDQQIVLAQRWTRQGLITKSESDRLTHLLSILQRPESPWIIDSRRLTLSQIFLYLGGWLVVLALSVGIPLAWGDIDRRWLVALACTSLALLYGVGVWLHRSARELPALSFLAAAALATPATTWILLRQTRWLAPAPLIGSPHPDTEFFRWIAGRDAAPDGLGNAQFLASWATCVISCSLLRLLSKSSAFTFLGSIALAPAWFGAWLVSGFFSPQSGRVDSYTWAWLGLWFLAGGIVLLVPVIRLGWVEESLARTTALSRVRRHDAPPLLILCILSLVGGLTAIAWYRPEWLGVPALVPGQPLTTKRAIAFMTSGAFQQVLSFVLTLRGWKVGTRGAAMLRWVVPNHICGSLVYLQLDHSREPGRWGLIWLLVLAGAAVSFALLSVWKQWKPFLFAGLGYLAVAYFRAFMLIDQHITKDGEGEHLRWILRSGLVAGLVVTGFLVMFLACRFPRAGSRSRVVPSSAGVS